MCLSEPRECDGSAAPPQTEEPLAPLGVLFVHGIGSQSRGQTLTECASALVELWMARTRQADGSVVPERTALTVDPEKYEPPYTMVRVTPAEDQASQRVFLAESWWAAEFAPPTFRTIAGWVLTYGSWIVLGHVVENVRRRFPTERPRWFGRVLRAIAQLAAIVSASVILFFVQLVLLLLAAIAILPIPPVRRAVAAAVLAMESLIGDSYAFSANPLVNFAVVGRVRRDIEWLSARCDRVVVVAHSQGAAVAVRALEHHLSANGADPARQRVRKLVTYGSGLRKLTELEMITRPPRRYPGVISYFWMLVAAVVLVTPALVRALYLAVQAIASRSFTDTVTILRGPLTWRTLFEPLVHIPVFYDRPLEYVVLAFILVGSAELIRRFSQAGETRAGVVAARMNAAVGVLTQQLAWVDMYATHDPVPAGAMPVAAAGRFTSREVTNRRSAIDDHVTYWRSPDEFVALVAEEINDVVPIVASAAAERRTHAATQRARRVLALVRIRRAVVAAAAVSIVFQARWLAAFGRTQVAPALAAVLPAWVRNAATGLIDSQSAVPQALASAMCFALGAMIPAAVAWIWYSYPCREPWEYWDKTDIYTFLRGDSPDTRVRAWALVFILSAVAAFVTVAVWTAIRGYPDTAADIAWGWNALQRC